MIHAIKHDFSMEKIEKAVGKLREAKLNILKSEFSKKSVLPASSYVPGKKAKEIQAMPVEEIIEKYRKK